jgi:hypothetical protein
MHAHAPRTVRRSSRTGRTLRTAAIAAVVALAVTACPSGGSRRSHRSGYRTDGDGTADRRANDCRTDDGDRCLRRFGGQCFLDGHHAGRLGEAAGERSRGTQSSGLSLPKWTTPTPIRANEHWSRRSVRPLTTSLRRHLDERRHRRRLCRKADRVHGPGLQHARLQGREVRHLAGISSAWNRTRLLGARSQCAPPSVDPRRRRHPARDRGVVLPGYLTAGLSRPRRDAGLDPDRLISPPPAQTTVRRTTANAPKTVWRVTRRPPIAQ